MNVQPLLEKIKAWWDSSDRTQKLVSVVGSILLVALIAGTAWFATRPKMEPIFPGASPAEQGIVRDAVLGYGFPADINPRGDVLVPVDKMPEIRMRLSQDGKIPSSALANNGGPTLPQESGFFQTPQELDQKLKAQKEAELSKSIMTLAGVQTAIVHINFGKDSPFGDQKVPPTAVVNVGEKPGTAITDGEGKAIARLVQNSIPGLEPKNVSVITNQGRIVYDGEEVNSEDAVANRKLEAEQQESKRREKELQKRLDVAFGPGATQAMVQVELNMDEVEIREQTETPGEAPISRDSVSEQLQGAPGRNAGAAGTESNLPGQAAARPEDDKGSSYKSETSSEKFPSSIRTTSTKKAAGGVESLSVSVLVDQTKVEDLQAVEAFVNGLLATAGERNFRATVVPTNFSNEAVARQERVAADAAAAQRMQQIMSVLPIVVLIGIGLMLIKALTKAVAPPPAPAAALAGAALPGGPAALGMTASAPHHPFQALEGPHPAGAPHPEEAGHSPEQTRPLVADREPEYDLSQLDDIDINSFRMAPGGAHDDEDPIASLQQMISNKKTLHQDLEAEEEDDDVPVHIRDIREKVDVPLERIRKMAKEKPEMIANLLKSWVMEDN